MELDKDFKEFAELLNAENVRYLIVGGYSVAHHGFPRYTGDFDIWIEPSVDNGNKMINVLKKFGFGSMDIKAQDFIKPDKIIQLGHEPLRIDILTSVDGLKEFSEAYKNRDKAKYGKLELSFISAEDLLINKRASNRTQDKRDIEELEKIKKYQDRNKGMTRGR